MEQIRADRGALGEGCVVINEGPDAYVMEDNRIRLEPGESLACVAVPNFGPMNSAYLYRMSREEAEKWARDRSLPPHRKPDNNGRRRLFRAYTEGTDYRAPVRFVEEDINDPKRTLTIYRTNFIGHIAKQ